MAWECIFADDVPLAQQGDREALARVIAQILDIVRSDLIARARECDGLAFEDLAQEAAMAAMHCVEKYSPERGHFVGYARTAIINAADHAVGRAGVLRPTRHGYRELKSLRQEEARNPRATEKEIAAALGMTTSRAEQIRCMSLLYSHVELDAPIAADSDGSTTLGDLLEDPAANGVALDACHERKAVAATRELFRALGDCEREIIRAAHSGGWGPELRAIVAVRWGLSPKGIDGVLERTLRKLRGYQIAPRGHRKPGRDIRARVVA